ncbi:helix-turn-helix domain-containing protein [Streptomyces cocklensis]|uniref:Helix-turn-helix domain-containing protein n=1 Tax=Actinacidiphila cocklensis TaxID=887465 RepID=A0A9W4E1G7_9ACTN|nr:helix-turn-helix transcriptional regulator [Actinacidiphila cocklensis]MDD1056815.1 helix-turn-helix domain-containing protein [Actinacidiphila cocklensis]WSX77965.1 helix-turn-helix domain-containing protein [Streptomyces sp. NBC_00899]CAG6397701.1 Helix-turn-helix domain-containing protein [Actinacidiphila cocklensis]
MATGIEDFAAQLRELKERSGHSYGMLATRLHVSTSTLHRYCNGAAVPGDYAPAERFARLCGATAEELVALHRRWLLADAAKRVPSLPAPVAPAPIPVPAAEPDVPATPRVRRRRRGAVAVAVAAAAAALAVVAAPALHSRLAADAPAATLPHPTPTPTAKAAAAPQAPAPVSVSVLSDNWDTQCDQWFLLAQQPGKVPPPPSLEETNGWAAALGGTPAGNLRLEVTAQGSPGRPVVLHGLYVKELSSRPAPAGIGYTTGSGCGGVLTPAYFDVDLDAAAPRATSVDGFAGNDQPPVVADFPFQVSGSESQVLDVAGHTVDRDVSWYLEILWSCGDRHGTLRVDDHGRPFRTVGLKGDPGYFYNGRAWEPTDVP